MVAHFLKRLLWPTGAGAFRLWLALVVVFHHVTRIEVGKAPVLVFFALSGYWVHRVWHRQYARTRRPWLTFIVSRWWRIAPILILSSAICVPLLWLTQNRDAVLVAGSSVWQSICAVTVLGYASLPTRPVGPAWSLDIEMQFYLVAPLLIFMVRRVSAVVVLALGGAGFFAAMALGAGVTLPSFLPFFLIGMVTAEHHWRPDPRLAQAGLTLAIALTAIAVWLPQGGDFIREGGSQSALFNLLLGLLAMPFAMATVSQRGDRMDALLADQSYLVYMLHWPAIAVLRYLDLPGPIANASVTILLGVAVAGTCLIVWRRVDRPLNSLRKHWVDRRMVDVKDSRCGLKGGDTASLLA